MSEPDAAVPVTLLTGFLGSGKTTVLNRLLRRPDMKGALVVVNEFGEVGLDHLLIEASEERFALLDNGCVCCTVRGDLVETLKDIDRRSAAGELPPVRRVLIETTGLADPAPILHTLMAEPQLSARYRLGEVVVTVDAVNGLATLQRHVEAARQAAVADRLLVTKTDLVNPADIAPIERRLRQLAPAAEIAFAVEGDIGSGDVAFEGGGSEGAHAERLAAALARAEAAIAHHAHDSGCGPECGRGGRHHHHDEHAHAHHGIQSYSFVIDKPVDWPAFAQWLDYIAVLKGEDLLRMKGIVNVAGEPERPCVIHGVQHVFHPPVRLEAWPSDDRRTRLVFIVRDIPRQTIERTLIKFAAVNAAEASGPARLTAA
ncbi:GTP-binding protein [Mesorhizobium sp. LHD-90]|uniref:CobW family GTP-binding protein n=1 Tax=Mesorhizobium sp. LHD-90 TaxID=3071414 RepID=UPI0027DEF90D|nr:GTP-binding protein [Mesorhizobium sp. LHD-90]MDQ6437518.1 GTP-binding protein [Mesorhizobium sp. LHD-90]